MALAALLEDEADLPLSPDGDDDMEAIAGVDMGLALGQAGASSGSPGMPALEACLLASEEVMIPSELCLNADVFIDVMSLGWASLTDQERIGLLKCLPSFPEPENNDFQEKLTTLDGLFAGADFHFGNPLKQFHASLNAGFYQPDVFRLREVSRKLKFHAHLERQQRHAVSLLCELATSRQQLLLDARCLPPAVMDSYRLNKRISSGVDKKPLAVKRARSRYAKIMFEVRQEAGWLDTSSSGEENDDQVVVAGHLQNQFGEMVLNGSGPLDEDSMVRNCLKLRNKSLKKSQKELSTSTSPPPPPLELSEVLERADIKPVTLTAGKIPKQQPLNGTSSTSTLMNKPKKPGQRRSRLEVLKLQCNDMVRKMLITPPAPAPPPLQPPVVQPQQQQLAPPPVMMMMKNGPIDSIMNTTSSSNSNGCLPPQPQQQQQAAPVPPPPVIQQQQVPQPPPPPPPPPAAQPRSRPQSSVALTPTPPPGPTPSAMDPTQTSPGGGSQQQRESSPPQLPPNLLAATSTGKVESFFHVIHAVLTASPESRATLTSMEQLVKQWVPVASATMNTPNAAAWHLRWLNDRSNWHNELPSALRFLSGTFCPANYPGDFVPLADMNDRSGHWVWLEDEQELSQGSSQYLCLLYRCWLDAQLGERQLPLLTSPFRPESEQDMYFFHDQERKRFQVATEPFMYMLMMPIQRELVVGPVRISPSRADSFSSSRKGLKDHSILTTERPPAVTVLTLVRDAVARLAGGEGTRTDICNLLRDSQFIRRDLNSHQLTNAVSGALDRLHSERDPCVRFDTTKKLWVYLHRGRSRDDFYRIGQMLMLAAKRRQTKDAAIAAANPSTAQTPATANGIGPPMPSPTGKASGSKSNARRASAVNSMENQAGPSGMLQRKTSMAASFAPEPQQQPQMMQQPVMLPPQIMQAQQLPSPSQQQQPQNQPSMVMNIQPQMFNAGPPMIRGPIPPQQMQQQQQQPVQQPGYPCIPSQYPGPFGASHQAPPGYGPPQMAPNFQGQMAPGAGGYPTPPRPPGFGGPPGMGPSSQHPGQPGQPAGQFYPQQQQQPGARQQQGQMGQMVGYDQFDRPVFMPQQQTGPPMGYSNQQQQQMLIFHHQQQQQQQQQQQYRLVHQQVASPTHLGQFPPPPPHMAQQPQPQQSTQNMMQQQPLPGQFQPHPHGL